MRFILWIGLCASLITELSASTQYSSASTGVVRKSSSSGELVFAVRLGARFEELQQVAEHLRQFNVDLPLKELKLVLVNEAPNGEFLHLVQFSPKGSSSFEFLRRLDESRLLEWASENYEYQGEARESLVSAEGYTPSDPLLNQQMYHDVMQTRYAWLFSRGKKEIVVAVTDDGVDVDHEDLRDNIWSNAREVANSGHDDDKNGYVDDVEGWNFIDDNNNPKPARTWGELASHGTHVAGIIAAVANNRAGISGIAHRSSVMPIKFYQSGRAWTSVMIAEAFRYAVDNGAKIISTSYNIDGFVGDPVFEAALDYVDQAGVLHFNSAGNNRQRAPDRRVFESLVLICSTDLGESRNNLLSSFSNWGEGIDLCAPGSNILSTIPDNKYEPMSGTSMATPAAAAVAALVWSANPSWTREQVVAQLYGTADDIDSYNPGREGGLGAGRANALRAVSGRSRAVQLKGIDTLYQTAVGGGAELRRIALGVKGLLHADSVMNPANFRIRALKFADEAASVQDPKEIFETVTWRLAQAYRIGSNEIILEASDALPAGRYELLVRDGDLYDPFHRALDGNRDTQPGGEFRMEFEVKAGEAAFRELLAQVSSGQSDPLASPFK